MRIRAYCRSLLGRGTKVESDLSNLVNVGFRRHLQNTRERGERKGPDDLVRHFLSPYRVREALRFDVESVRSTAFYHFLLARTRFYDESFLEAIRSGVGQILIIGAGTDTRAYRFNKELKRAGIQVVEADQSPAIQEKQEAARALGDVAHVRWVELDLETVRWADWLRDAGIDPGVRTFVMMEGVAPYLTEEAYGRTIRTLASSLAPGSQFSIDFRLQGRGEPEDRCRLPDNTESIESMHQDMGVRPLLVLRGKEVQRRYNSYESQVELLDAVLRAEI